MPHIKVNDISMYYEIHGEGEPVVLVGGFSSDMTVWTAVTDILKTRHKVIVFDNRGAGRTDAPPGAYSIEQMTDDLAALCAQLGLTHAHFVGNSMGGFILQTLAVQYPQLVKTMIISNSTTNSQCAFRVYVDAQLKLLKAKAPLRDIIHASSSWIFSYQFLSQPGVLDELIQIGVDNPYPFTISGYEGQLAALDNFDSSDWIQNITVPTLILAGTHDLVFSEKSIRWLAKTIPKAEYYCFNECGHLPLVEFPEKFSTLVADFVLRHQ